MEGVEVVSISDLLQWCRPISGTFSVLPPYRPTSPPPTSGYSTTLNPNSIHHSKILKSLPYPSIIIGTLALPTFPDHSSSNSSSNHNCFSFSDESASVCCADVLDFDVRMIGKKVHILAWNFLPFKSIGGFLEIIGWKVAEDSSSSAVGCSNYVVSVPLVLGSPDVGEASHKACYRVCGVLGSVSTVSVVPCKVGGIENYAGGNSRTKPLSGFLVQILACECNICNSSDFVRDLENLNEEWDRHSFSKEVFVYFGSAPSWHPAISKLIGNVISLSRLRKKFVYIGKEEGQLMLVTTHETSLQVQKLKTEGIRCRSCDIKWKGECGDYTGVVRGIYMQGMVVELDEEVWLLLTDQILSLPHSIRVGAVIFARNVHFVNPKFSWTKMLILGACCKTSIILVSFSPLEARCHLSSPTQSLLRKYIGSLAFSARLWVLLVAQCFRKKFAGFFSEKQILGSKHTEGLVQSYARSILPSSVYHSTHVAFRQFGKHDSSGCYHVLTYGCLNLVVPFSNFVNNCEIIWIKSLLQVKGGLEMIESSRQFGSLRRNSGFHGQSTRRNFRSKDIGVVLTGKLKVSPHNGRLQLIDATCSIDAVIPDLPSTWNVDKIYELASPLVEVATRRRGGGGKRKVVREGKEVADYTLVLEGVPESMDHMVMLDYDPLSCRSIFDCIPLRRQTSLLIYVFFLWRNVIHRCTPIDHCLISNLNYSELERGLFHLLHLTHIFPVQPNFQSDTEISDRSSMFAEAVVLPWDLCLGVSTAAALPVRFTEARREDLNGSPQKRCKIKHASDWVQSREVSSLKEFGTNSYIHLLHSCMFSPKSGRDQNSSSTDLVEIPCLITIRGLDGKRMVSSGFLHSNKANVERRVGCSTGLRKVLLEFKSECFFKHKLLRIGACYITKHDEEDSFCDFKELNFVGTVAIKPEMHLWSASFWFDECLSISGPSDNQSSDCCSPNDSLSVGFLREDLLFHSSGSSFHDSSADVQLHVSADVISLLDPNYQVLRNGGTDCLVCQPNKSRPTVTNSVQCLGTSYSCSPLLEGDLITVHGTVVAVHHLDCYSVCGNSCDASVGGVHQMRFFQDRRICICLHVLTHNHIVKIDGALSKCGYPIGLGPGAIATFHRVLAFSGQNHFMLTAVSFISVNSVGEVAASCGNESFHSWTASNLFSCVLLDPISSCSIVDLIQCLECEPRRFRCRVVAVYIVRLERNNKLDRVLSKIHCRIPIVDIPLAGFILDDGSSPCCCWANAERAATFLRLHEEMPASVGSCWWGSKQMQTSEACSSPALHLDRILKQHRRIVVKNYGSVVDSLCQDVQLSIGSDYIISTLDEDLLKLIILNACSGNHWSVVGCLMHANAVLELEKYLEGEQMKINAMPNIWAREVCQVDPLAEARGLLQNF
ncbi:hypothetical protein Ancab_016179 [Ancistrocladus abbreviatus]